MGILQDAHLSTQQYGTLSLLFYVAFLVFELPHAYLMQRLPTAKYLGCMVCAWGAMVACTSACSSYQSLATLRFLLGMFESAISPSLILITSMWYRRREQPRRVGTWYIGVGCAGIIGSLMSFGFQHYEGTRFRSWQIMFLVVGLITIFFGVLVILFLPDNPMSSRLTHAEKVAAVERLRENQTGVENKTFKWYQVKQCALDPQTWLLALIVTAASIPNGAVGSFQSIVIKSFGFTNKQTTLLQLPHGVISVGSVLLATYTAGRFNARGLNIVFWSSLGGLVGGGMLAFSNNRAVELTGNYLTGVLGAFLPCAYSFAAANQAGHTKKVTINAIVLMSFCLGNILGPLTFRNSDAPNYIPAKITIVAVDSVAILATLVLLFYYRWQNKIRDKIDEVVHVVDQEFADMTDRDNKEFRYAF